MLPNRTEQPQNNALHDAILARENDRAIALVKSMNRDEINHKSLGNTPLMLALKTANFAVAKALLERDDVRAHFTDTRGIVPLQLALAWRETEIILKIMDKYDKSGMPCEHEIDVFKLPGRSNILTTNKTPKRTLAAIYENYDMKKLERDITTRGYYKEVVDSPGSCLDSAPELVDPLLFHSDLICLNLNLLTEDKLSKLPSSQHRFAENLKNGLTLIIEARNGKPKDEKVLERLGVTPIPAAQSSVKAAK